MKLFLKKQNALKFLKTFLGGIFLRFSPYVSLKLGKAKNKPNLEEVDLMFLSCSKGRKKKDVKAVCFNKEMLPGRALKQCTQK